MFEQRVRPALLDLSTLAVSLMGFLGLITITLQLKSGVMGVPRSLFLLFLAMVCAPFLSALWGLPRPVFLIAPVVAVFLLYPVAAPHGIIFGRDPIFNYAFTERVASTRSWVPGGPGGLAETYSLYPLGNVFMAYLILSASLPGEVAFLWIEPVLRLLALPAAVYAIGRRIFGPRIAVLGVLLYMGTASILFNAPVQQGMGVIFVALAILSLLLLTQVTTTSGKQRTQLLFALVAAGIVMTHHLSSYIFAAWLVTLAVFMIHPRLRPSGSGVRLTYLALYFVAILNLYIAVVSFRVFVPQAEAFEIVWQRLLSPESLPQTATPRLGRTFTPLEIGWLVLSALGTTGLAWITVRRYRREARSPFAVANGTICTIMFLVTLPFVATGAEFLPLRIGEYANLFLAPFAAATLLRWARPGLGRWSRFVPDAERQRVEGWLPTVAVLVVSAALFMGGNLVPHTMRPYFEDESQWNTDTPLLFGADARRMAAWGREHYGRSTVWGDHLVVDIFAGFGDMHVEFGSSFVFANATLDDGVWDRLAVGDFVAVSRSMLDYPSQFYLEPEPAVRAPMDEEQIAKFARSRHFSLVYQDGSFSVYRVVSEPSP